MAKRSMTKTMGAELRARAEARRLAQGDPAAEARRHEQSMLDSFVTATRDLEWLAIHEGWKLLGFDTCADWWQDRVRPITDALGLAPSADMARRLVEIIRREEQSLPATQRRTQKELAAVVGRKSDWIARPAQDRSERGDHDGSDLDGSADDPLDVQPSDVRDEPPGPTSPRPGEPANCEECGAALTMNERHAGHYRCASCDPGQEHIAEALGFEEGWGACTGCALAARLAALAAADTAADGDTAPVEPADAAVVVVGGSEPDVGGLGPGDLVSPIGRAIANAPAGSAHGPLDLREELIEEEAATPPVVTPSHPEDSPAADTDDTASQVVLQQSGADAPIPLGAPDGGGVDLPPPSLSGITSETEGVPWETADVDHRPAATGVSPVGREAPERPPLSVEPVLEDGGPAPALPSSSSDPEEPICGESYDHTLELIDEADGQATYECRECGAEVFGPPLDEPPASEATNPVDALVGRFTQFAYVLLQQTDPLVLGPLLHDDDLLTLRSVVAELDAYVGRLSAARTPGGAE